MRTETDNVSPKPVPRITPTLHDRINALETGRLLTPQQRDRKQASEAKVVDLIRTCLGE